MVFFLIIFLTFLLISYSILIFYYRYCWLQIPSFNLGDAGQDLPANSTVKITVIIPARNEALTIRKCLKAITAQIYSAHLFEVIVVDDHSTDDTALVVRAFNNTNIRCIALQDYVPDPINSYKKKAIEVAIAQAIGELIITTDADCFMGKYWLQTIAFFYENYQPVFIAAPVSISSNQQFLSVFQALDFMTLQGITGAAVFKKMHSMCNGANLAYTKQAFYDAGGFNGIDNIASGDDMLLMHKIFARYPDKVMFLKSRGAIVQTQAMDTWKNFFNQRIRWASKAEKYNDKRILPVLLLVYILNFLLLVLPVTAMCSNYRILIFTRQFSLMQYWLLLLVFKTLAELIFLYPVAVFFEKKNILWWFPLAQPLHILYTIIAGWLGKFGNYQWKGRNVK